MKFRFRTLALISGVAFLLTSVLKSGAFALLGPVEPWMQTTNGVILPGDIGGPMYLSNEYRWNVPVVTYGFDKSFLDYFGTNGVVAIESAIQTLNDLPPASELVLTNYPFYSRQVNYEAQAESLIDLKSQTLSLLLEHLGLAQPTRSIFVLKQWTPAFIDTPSQNDWYVWAVPDYIVQRNFDPQSLEASPYFNGVLYAASVISGGPDSFSFINNIPVDPLAESFSAVADFNLRPGEFYSGLTYDDVGGLAFLLSTSNVNFETLPPDVVGVGTNANSFVNGAWRPGVEKITFIPQLVEPQSGAFLPMTNCFNDSFIINGFLQQQQVARIIKQPDFLFSVGDVNSGSPELALFSRTGATNWSNNAAVNEVGSEAGPGVIQPPVQITYDKVGPELFSQGGFFGGQVLVVSLQHWASFDGSTGGPVIYPISQAGINSFTVRMWLILGADVNHQFIQSFQHSFEWSLTSPPGATFLLQTSTNLTDWVLLAEVHNDGSVWTYFNNNPASASRFYRLIPQ